MKVGFFDSGLGGLTVLKEALNNKDFCEDVYYLADTKNTPYGTKNEDEVRKMIDDNISYLVDIGCNPIVIACNTATSLSINSLREKYKNIEFIGTEPAVKVATDSKMNKKILVLATTITINQEKLLNLIDKLQIDNDDIVLRSADKLVEYAENEKCLFLDQEIDRYITEMLSEYDLTLFSHIVLGCTHFPLFKKNFNRVITRLCPNSDIKVIDSAEGITKQLFKKIGEIKGKEEINEKNSQNLYVILTKNSLPFISRTKEILGYNNIHFENKLQ